MSGPKAGFLVGAILALAILCPATNAQGQTPRKVAELYRQSYVAEARQDYDESLSLMAKVRALGVDDYVLNLRTGWLMYLAGRYEESILSYRAAVRLEPGAIEPRLGLMLPLMAVRKWSEARTVGVETLEKAPGDFTAQSRIAFIHYQQGQYEKAESWYRKALAGYPSNVEMRAGLAWSLFRQNRFPEARAGFQQVLDIAPDHASALEGIAQVP